MTPPPNILTIAQHCHRSYAPDGLLPYVTSCKKIVVGNLLAYYWEDDDRAYIIIPGTNDILDWLKNNFRWRYDLKVYLQQSIKIHKGFWAGATNLIDALSPHLPYDRDKPITAAGHSLGSAISSCMAMMLAESGRAVGSTYSFGGPRWGDLAAMKRHEKLGLAASYVRCVNDRDGVPRFLPSSLGGCHVLPGKVWVFDEQLPPQSGEPAWDWVTGQFPTASLLLGNLAEAVRDHSMGLYVEGAKKVVGE